jgi:hypothetical protein
MVRIPAHAGDDTLEGVVEVWLMIDEEDNCVGTLCLMADDPRNLAIDQIIGMFPYKRIYHKRIKAGFVPSWIANRLGDDNRIDESQIVMVFCPTCGGSGRVMGKRGTIKCKTCQGLTRILKLKTPDIMPKDYGGTIEAKKEDQ